MAPLGTPLGLLDPYPMERHRLEWREQQEGIRRRRRRSVPPDDAGWSAASTGLITSEYGATVSTEEGYRSTRWGLRLTAWLVTTCRHASTVRLLRP